MTADDLKALVRTVPDFPKAGILFRDITTLIGHGEGFAASVAMLAERAAERYQGERTARATEMTQGPCADMPPSGSAPKAQRGMQASSLPAARPRQGWRRRWRRQR